MPCTDERPLQGWGHASLPPNPLSIDVERGSQSHRAISPLSRVRGDTRPTEAHAPRRLGGEGTYAVLPRSARSAARASGIASGTVA